MEQPKNISDAAKRALAEAEQRRKHEAPQILPREINGRGGLEPTRYDDWERKGIICDF